MIPTKSKLNSLKQRTVRSQAQEAGMCLREKTPVLDELPAGMSSGAAVGPGLMNQQYILSKVSWDRAPTKQAYKLIG